MAVYDRAVEEYDPQNCSDEAIAIDKKNLPLSPNQKTVSQEIIGLHSQWTNLGEEMPGNEETSGIEGNIQDSGSGNARRGDVFREIVLIDEDEAQLLLEKRDNGSLWQSGKKIFMNETEANEKGWRIDSVKIFFNARPEKSKIRMKEVFPRKS